MRKRTFWTGPIFFSLFIFPLILVCRVFFPPVFNLRIIDLLGFSFILAALGTFLSLLIALPISFCAAGGSIFAKILSATALIPFFLPINIGSVLVYRVFQDFFNFFSMEGRGTFWGLLLSHALYEAPVIVFYTAAALRGIPQVYLAQMREDGLSIFRGGLFCLRMVRGQIIQASAIVFLYIFQSTALVMNIGLGRYETLESAILSSFGMRADFSLAVGMSFVQTLFLAPLFFFTTGNNRIRFSLTADKQKMILPVFWGNYLCSGLFLLLILYWILPLFIRAWQGIEQLASLGDLFPLWSSILNSLIISFLSAVISVFLVLLWNFLGGGRVLICAMAVPQSLYFIGVLLCGLWWGLPSLISAVWALALAQMPIVYFFLKSGEITEDQDIIRSARLEGAAGWRLWKDIYRPLWKERYLNAVWKSMLLAFGNFSFAYIVAQNRIPMAAATLNDLLNRRYMAAADSYAAVNFLLMLALMLLMPRKKVIN